MKKINKYIFTILALSIFVWFNWATSQPDEEVYLDFNATAELHQLNNIILSNLDTVDITEGILVLTPNQITGFDTYKIEGFELAIGMSDTIPLPEFVATGGANYPDSIPPLSLSLQFHVPPITYFSFYHEF